jgi:cyclic pyranopterin monophosphate synthase
MRDVSSKPTTLRIARARGMLTAAPETIDRIRRRDVPKGDPLEGAKLAAIMAAKNTPLVLPYCHPLPVDSVRVAFDFSATEVLVEVEVKAIYKTGVEMEALTATCAALLNLYDMLKMFDGSMSIGPVELLEKCGGKSDRNVHARDFRAAVLVVSDSVSAGSAQDRSGCLIRERLEEEGGTVVRCDLVPDDVDRIRAAAMGLLNEGIDFLVTTGGTGLGPRDVTPEAMSDLIETDLPGVEEAMRAYGQQRTPLAMLSRSRAGRRGGTIILCLPGSPGAVTDALNATFPHVLHALHIREGGGHA